MDPAVALAELPPLDVVVLSHNHYDHLDRSAVRRIARAHPRATWVVPLRLGGTIRAWGVREIVELDWWQEASIGSLRVTATPARHMSARRLGDRNQTLWCGFALEATGRRVFFAGDTAYHPQFGGSSADLPGCNCGASTRSAALDAGHSLGNVSPNDGTDGRAAAPGRCALA
jgi:N-acyl-phosphatidylethanolamine-hydrolysing phospholipase D